MSAEDSQPIAPELPVSTEPADAVEGLLRNRRRALLLSLLGALIAMASLGSAFMPTLIVYEPLLLIALSPLGRHMLMVAPLTAMAPFVMVGSLRRLLAAVLGYYLGKEYGQEGIDWVEGRSELMGKVVRVLERAFTRAGYLILFIAPGPPIAAMAGVARMPLPLVIPIVLAGQIMWLSITYLVGDALSEWIMPIVDFIRAYVVEATVVCVVLVLGYRWYKKRTGNLSVDLPG